MQISTNYSVNTFKGTVSSWFGFPLNTRANRKFGALSILRSANARAGDSNAAPEYRAKWAKIAERCTALIATIGTLCVVLIPSLRETVAGWLA